MSTWDCLGYHVDSNEAARCPFDMLMPYVKIRAIRIKNVLNTCYIAHPSSNHNNERLVKIASRMQQTGESEIMVNIYFIASNGFILECVDREYEYDEFDESEDDAESPEKKEIQIT